MLRCTMPHPANRSASRGAACEVSPPRPGGRLRNKLREYYAAEGRDARVRIELPKGQCRPVIRMTAAGVPPAAAPAASGAGTDATPPSSADRPTPLRRVRTAGAIAAAVVATLTVGLWIGIAQFGAPASTRESALTGGADLIHTALAEAPALSAPATAAAVARVPQSVAVLPFENRSSNPEHAYFAGGMHESVLHQLERLGLSVFSRTSMLRYADAPRRPLPEIAAELGAQSVLEGSVGFDGERVLVQMRLVDGATDRQLWSGRYDRPFASVFDVQADIATNVAEELRAELSPLERASVATPPTISTEAYAVYLILESSSPEKRVQLIDRALELDPEFALAHAFKAFLLSQQMTGTAFGPPAHSDERARIEERVRYHADRALGIDPVAPYANIALANLSFFTWRWTVARQAFRRAAGTSPNDPALLHYAYLDSYTGRHEDAIRRIERLIPLNPYLPVLHSILGITKAHAGDLDGAVESLHTGLAAPFNPPQLIERSWLVAVQIRRGNADAALRELRLIEDLGGADDALGLPLLAHAYARLGRHADAERLFAAFERSVAAGRRAGAGGWAEAHLAVGNHAEALQWIERGAATIAAHEPDPHFYPLIHLRMNLLGDPVLERPEFAAALGKIVGD